MRHFGAYEIDRLGLLVRSMKRTLTNPVDEGFDWRREFEIWCHVFEEFHSSLEKKMLLFPDMTKEQPDAGEFCFATPCTLDEWTKLSRSGKVEWVKNFMVPYIMVKEDKEKIAIILMDSGNTDDEAMTLAAYLRMVQDFTGMIYALPYTHDTPDMWIGSIIARTSGVDPKKVRHIEVD